MTLDALTLQVAAGLTIVTVATIFVVDARDRGDDPVDRLWGAALACGIVAAGTFVVAAGYPAMWWANAIGNAATVLTTCLLWSGSRRWVGRSSELWLPVLLALAASGTTLAVGSPERPWAGGTVLLGATALGALGAGTELLRARRRRSPVVVLLAVVLLTAGAYYLLRLVLLLTAGPDSAVFERWAGTAPASIAIIVLYTCAAFGMITLRTDDRARERLRRANYDPMTGARTIRSFRPLAAAAIAGDRATHRPVAMVTLDLDDHTRLTAAFDASVARRAVVVLGEVVLRLLPPLAIMGREDHRTGFDVLLPGRSPAEAQEWADRVRAELARVPVEVATGHLRLRLSIGVAGDASAGYDLDDLAQVCRDAAMHAGTLGGNRVHVATVEEGTASLARVGRSIGAPR